MIDIAIHSLVKAFEKDNNILDGLSMEINSGERVGILGKNGAGKTTLFRIIAGLIESDEGDVSIAASRRIGLISQIPEYPASYTTEDVLKSAHSKLYKMADKLESLRALMSDDEAVIKGYLSEYDRLSADFERLGGYSMDIERNKVANGLDIPSDMRVRIFSELSGGEKTRVNLARLILEDTDILLLDEPTNHLDMRAVEWLEEYLLKFPGTVLAISHDRYFLDRIAQRTIEIVNGKAEFYSGNYSFYVIERQRRFDEHQSRYEKEQVEAKRLTESATRLRQWASGNSKLMKKALAIESRIQRTVKTERPVKDKSLRAGFSEREFRGDIVMALEGVSMSFGSRQLFSGFDADVTGGERIALIGDNGTGKSTLLKIIMGEDSPDAGRLYIGPSVKTAYLPQIIEFQDKRRTILDTLIYELGCTPQTARNRLGAFKFSGEDVFKPVYALSGGEQSRLRLCMLMNGEINFLILDEPTNHLDIDSREWIENALEDYSETLLFVSHDRYFLDKFATRVWELRDGVIRDFLGTFSEYRHAETANKANLMQNSRKNDVSARENKKPPKPVSIERQRAKTERDIEALESKQQELETLADEFSSDYLKLMEISKAHDELNAELDALYLKWEELSQ